MSVPAPDDRLLFEKAYAISTLTAAGGDDGIFRLLFRRHPVTMWIYDPATLRFLEVNDAAIRQYGYTRDEFLSMTLADIRPCEDMPRLQAALQSALQDAPWGSHRELGVWRHSTKEGSLLDVELVTTSLPCLPAGLGGTTGPREVRVAFASDVTERLRAEEALRLRDSAIEASSDGIVLVDALQPDCPIVSVNHAFECMTGYPASEALGRNCRFLQGTDTDQPQLEVLRRGLAAGEPVEVTLRNYRKDGTLFYNELHIAPIRDDAGKVTHFVGILNDVTARRRAEEEMRHIMRSARCLLWSALVTDTGGETLIWKYLHYDEEAAQRFLSIEVPPGQTYFFAAYLRRHPEDRARADREGTACVRAGQNYTQEFRCLDATGQWQWQHEEIQVETLRPGHWRVVGVTTDVTERKKAEEHQQQLFAALEEATARQRRFVQDVLLNVTEGRLRLCNSEEELPHPPEPACSSGDGRVVLAPESLSTFRAEIRAAAHRAGLPEPRGGDLMIGAGEAAMNAVVHGGGGIGQVYADTARGVTQVWIRDRGRGIQEHLLHRATLERGWSTAGTQGQGFWMMLHSCDRIWLLTGASGTTVVLEQGCQPEEE